jgi:hypothetical protein
LCEDDGLKAPQFLLVHRGTLRIARRPSDGVYSVVNLSSASEAYQYLRRHFENRPKVLAMLEVFSEDEVLDEEQADELDDQEEQIGGNGRSQSQTHLQAMTRRREALDVLKVVARMIADGEVGVAEQLERFNPPTKTQEAEPPPVVQPPLAKPPKALTWAEFRVVDDATGKPVNWVRLVVRTPDGNQNYHTTDADGLVRAEELEPGKCDVSCELKNPLLASTLAFVAMGDAAASSGGEGKQGKPGTLIIANIERHKVKKGESLDALAKKAGMTWKELAKFNWGTDVPDEINKHLKDDVGCTKKTKDGLNYVFDDSDKPGIVFIPTKWEESGLACGMRHTLRVRRLTRFFVRLENDLGVRIPEVKYEAVLADGKQISGELGIGGVDAIDDPPEGEVEVSFPDLDDIEAKSVAASARKAFDDRDPKEIHRFFRYAKETVKKAIEAYDKYFNDYRGKGLKNDIEEEFFEDEDGQLVFGAYLLGVEKEPAQHEDDGQDIGMIEIEGQEEASRV